MTQPALVLYSNPMSRGRIARWMLEESGADYSVEYLDYGTTMKSADYLALNPMGKVPAIRHGEHVVTEAAAICAYMADTFPDAGLAPDADERADYYRWLFFATGPLESAITLRALGAEPTPEKESMAGFGTLARALDTLEYAVARHDFIAGDRFTAADVYVGSQIGFGLQFGTMEKRPVFTDYWERVSARPAYGRALALDNAALENAATAPS